MAVAEDRIRQEQWTGEGRSRGKEQRIG